MRARADKRARVLLPSYFLCRWPGPGPGDSFRAKSCALSMPTRACTFASGWLEFWYCIAVAEPVDNRLFEHQPPQFSPYQRASILSGASVSYSILSGASVSYRIASRAFENHPIPGLFISTLISHFSDTCEFEDGCSRQTEQVPFPTYLS
ncbi:hypothetical protein BC834DRAFT_196188 [Gloeopeniophorella convolvens]|nr:hypothetical protein BC834DRAFT_196188 [Gloeopeniophorella convolvens]